MKTFRFDYNNDWDYFVADYTPDSLDESLFYRPIICGESLRDYFVLPKNTKTIWLTISKKKMPDSYEFYLKDYYVYAVDKHGKELRVRILLKFYLFLESLYKGKGAHYGKIEY